MQAKKDAYEIELICLDKAIDFDTFLKFLFASSSSKIDRICVPTSLLHKVPEISEYVEMVSLVDYPDGLGSTHSRVADALYSMRSGVKYIDVTLNNMWVTDGDWRSIVADIKTLKSLCDSEGVELRTIIEYRLHPLDLVLNTCKILKDHGIKDIVSSTGRMAGDIVDNLLFCERLLTTLGLDPIVCGRLYTKDQLEVFKNVGLKRFRVTSLKIAENLLGKLY
jgi:deoxyribose-phosphate aldolase